MLAALMLASITAVIALGQASGSEIPRFEDYPTPEIYRGAAAVPILGTAEQRDYRTRIRNGVTRGDGVWNESWKSPVPSNGPNFAGRYFVIRWGCGSDCLMMVIVDAKTGRVYNSPMSGSGTGLFVNLDIMSDREIDFRPNSSLMVLRNACRVGRSECGIYYFKWETDKFRLLKRVLVDLAKEP